MADKDAMLKELKALEQQLEPLEQRARELRKAISTIDYDARLAADGLEIGMPLVITDRVYQHLCGRDWMVHELERFGIGSRFQLEKINTGGDVYGQIGNGHYGTGNIPLDLIVEMAEAAKAED